LPYDGAPGLLTIPCRLDIRPFGRSARLLLKALPVGAFTL
jgi:hypothetical protein